MDLHPQKGAELQKPSSKSSIIFFRPRQHHRNRKCVLLAGGLEEESIILYLIVMFPSAQLSIYCSSPHFSSFISCTHIRSLSSYVCLHYSCIGCNLISQHSSHDTTLHLSSLSHLLFFSHTHSHTHRHQGSPLGHVSASLQCIVGIEQHISGIYIYMVDMLQLLTLITVCSCQVFMVRVHMSVCNHKDPIKHTTKHASH